MVRGSWMKQMSAGIVIAMLLVMTAACGAGSGSNASPAADANKNTAGSTAKESPKAAADTGAAAAKPNADQGEFVLWSWDAAHPQIMEEFNKKYPNIKMKLVNVAAADVTKKLQTTIASGGELPDLIRIERGQRAKIFDMNILQNLESAPFDADKKQLFDYDIETFSREGHLVAIPDDMSVAGMAYVKKLAKDYLGTDNPEELQAMFPNWDAFIEKGKEVVQKSGGKVRMFPGLGDVYTFIRGQRSGPFFNGDKLDTAVLQKVVTDLVKFRDSGTVDKLDQWTPAWNASFAQDKYIFAMAPVWMPQYVIGPNDKAQGRWGLMVAPGGGFIAGGSSHGIPKGAKNGELAWKWVKFVSLTQEGAEVAKKDGIFTHYKKAYDNQTFAKWTWPNFGDQDIGKKFFVDISQTTKDVQENVNDMVLGEVMNIVLQTLAKDSSFGVTQAMDRIKAELKAKAPTITMN